MKPDISEIMTNEELRKIVGLTIEDFDEELKMLGNAAIKKLVLSGVLQEKIIKTDSYLKQTITAYIRGNFRYTDAAIAEENRQIFEENKNFISLTTEYTKKES